MSDLFKKFKILIILIKPFEAFVQGLFVTFCMYYFTEEAKLSHSILGGTAWMLMSFSSAIIREVYETTRLKIIFPWNVLQKEVVSTLEAMAYYVYFTISAMILSTIVGTLQMIAIVLITLFNLYSAKACRKNPYRFPFSRGIVAAFMFLYSTIDLDVLNLFLYPAVFTIIFVYISTFLFYSRYYEEITDDIAKSLICMLIPICVMLSFIPLIKKWYDFDYIYLALGSIDLFLVYLMFRVSRGYRSNYINAYDYILKALLLIIPVSVYLGLQ